MECDVTITVKDLRPDDKRKYLNLAEEKSDRPLWNTYPLHARALVRCVVFATRHLPAFKRLLKFVFAVDAVFNGNEMKLERPKATKQ